jgi:GTP cyclohydrolase II
MDKPIKPRSKNLRRPQRKRATDHGRASLIPGLNLIEVERAAGDLRAGLPVMVTDADGACLVAAPETISREMMSTILAHIPNKDPFFLLTAERGDALKLRRYTPGTLALPIRAHLDALWAMRDLADPSRDLSNPLRGPFAVRREPLPPAAGSAVRIMKIANLLPGAFGWFFDKGEATRIVRKLGVLSASVSAIDSYRERAVTTMRMITQAKLPLESAENTQILAFGPQSGGREHLVLLIGDPSPERPPLVRIHSECFTGDLLGSLKCDCGDQLRGAIARMGADPHGGVLLYLAQEGRGIGLINKLRAYNLQDQGFDTVDANTRLGFEPDERVFSVASEILKRLGFTAVRLLTNNPEKVAALEDQGVRIVERVPHAFPENPHNAGYLKVKARRTGHLL